MAPTADPDAAAIEPALGLLELDSIAAGIAAGCIGWRFGRGARALDLLERAIGVAHVAAAGGGVGGGGVGCHAQASREFDALRWRSSYTATVVPRRVPAAWPSKASCGAAM